MARMPSLQSKTALAGFTLIEALTTTAVICLAAAISLPSLAAMITHHRVITTSNALVTDLNLARSHAINRREPVTICPSSNMTTCSQNKDWSMGWIIFMARNGRKQPGTSEDIVWIENRRANPRVRIFASSGRDVIRYLADGRSSGTNVTLRICVGEIVESQVVLNNAGRIRTERSTTSRPCTQP
jgi:type IV fimbrial biogenesis protein FimT